MKTITRYTDNGFVLHAKLNFSQVYDYAREFMPLGVRWIVDTGTCKRLYFWFCGNKYQGNQLCWTNLPSKKTLINH